MTAGRPTKYDPKYCAEIISYFDIDIYPEDDNGKRRVADLPTVIEFAHSIGVCRDTIHEWTTQHEEFSDSYKKAKLLQESLWRKASMLGLYNTAFTIFMGKNVFKWTDRQEIDQKLTGNMNIEVVKFADTDTE